MIPLAYCGYSSKQQRHSSLFFFKCYRFAIIDIKQYSNHSAYIHICTGEYKKKCYSILLFKLFLLVKGIVQLNFLLITFSVEVPGIGRNSFPLGNSRTVLWTRKCRHSLYRHSGE